MSLPRALGLSCTVHVALIWAHGPWIWTQFQFGTVVVEETNEGSSRVVVRERLGERTCASLTVKVSSHRFE